MRRLAAASVLTAFIFIGSTIGVSAADLAGETLTWVGVAGGEWSFPCSAGSVNYGVGRPGTTAMGPYTGTFTETGTITFSGGVVTAWTADFAIFYTVPAPGGTVYGHKVLAPGGGGPASCTPGVARCTTGTADATATLIYTSDFPTPTVSGPSMAVLHVVSVPGSYCGNVTGTFSESFGAAVQAGCNTNASGQLEELCSSTGQVGPNR
jgi:hypothetical protein